VSPVTKPDCIEHAVQGTNGRIKQPAKEESDHDHRENPGQKVNGAEGNHPAWFGVHRERHDQAEAAPAEKPDRSELERVEE
jgi:hypothetical protein